MTIRMMLVNNNLFDARRGPAKIIRIWIILPLEMLAIQGSHHNIHEIFYMSINNRWHVLFFGCGGLFFKA